MDLVTKARGLEFQCLGLAKCAAESPGARCPCARRLAEQRQEPAKRAADGPTWLSDYPGAVGRPVAQSERREGCCRNPPAPTLGDVLGPLLARRARGQAAI